MADNTKVEGFTPGPWRLVEDFDQIGKASHRVYSVHADVQTRAGRYAFCGLARITADRGDAMLEANARLIAAAPTMHEALAKIEALTKPGQELDISQAVDLICEVWNIARAATSGNGEER